MNRKEAIEESIKIWTELAETGGEKSSKTLLRYLYGCPLCDLYRYKDGTDNCDDKCPLKELTGNKCNGKDSIFIKWTRTLIYNEDVNTRIYYRKKYAEQILQYLKYKLKEETRCNIMLEKVGDMFYVENVGQESVYHVRLPNKNIHRTNNKDNARIISLLSQLVEKLNT